MEFPPFAFNHLKFSEYFIMGAGQSTEKKSPIKEVKETSRHQESPKKDSPSKIVKAEVNNVKTPTKTPESSGDAETVTTTVEVTKVSEEDLAEVEAAAKKIRDSLGGTSIEIVLSPAVKKVTFPLFCENVSPACFVS